MQNIQRWGERVFFRTGTLIFHWVSKYDFRSTMGRSTSLVKKSIEFQKGGEPAVFPYNSLTGRSHWHYNPVSLLDFVLSSD